MSNLECSSRGDRRFSAFCAQVSFFGRVDSIENIYQSVKRDSYGTQVKKGAKVDYIDLAGLCLSPKYLTPFYKMLWVKYLDCNPELVQYASQFDTFSDMFRGKCINCQADVIRDYVKLGRSSLMGNAEVIELNNLILEHRTKLK